MAIFGKLFESKEKRLQRESADAEMHLVHDALSEIYGRNNADFFQRPEAAKLAIELVLAKPLRDVGGLFALGVAMEAIEKLPPLPTAPYDRGYIHLMRFFSQHDVPFEQAQERVILIKGQVESLDRVAAYIVAQGREAVRDGKDPTYLTKCFERVHRRNLILGTS